MSLVSPRCSPVFGLHHGEHPCANLLIMPSDRQSLHVEMRNWAGLVRFGSYRIKEAKSAGDGNVSEGGTYHEKRDLNGLEVHHVIKRTHRSLDPLK